MSVPVAPSRGPRPGGRLSRAERLSLLAWGQLAFTLCCVGWWLLTVDVVADGGRAMACFDGDELACAARSPGLLEHWRAIAVGAVLVAAAVSAAAVAHRHRQSPTRRRTAIALLGVSVTLDGLAAVASLTL